MPFRAGQVLIEEVDPRSAVSRLVQFFSNSRWTHAALVVGPNEAVEANYPRVRTFNLSDRLVELTRTKRGYVILDDPTLTDTERDQIAARGRQYVGRLYDVLELCLYAVFGRFIQDGTKRVVCSRLVSGAYQEGAGKRLFGHLADDPRGLSPKRVADLLKGYCTPQELVSYSSLSVAQNRAWLAEDGEPYGLFVPPPPITESPGALPCH